MVRFGWYLLNYYGKIQQRYHMKRVGSEMIQSTNYRTYFHLAYIESLFIRITKNSYYLPAIEREVDATKHGPAFGVMPVLIPDHPYHSILFVFYHFIHPLRTYYAYWQQYVLVQCFVMTTSLNLGCFIANMQRRATSSALERLQGLERPWGLAQWDRLSPILRARRFISWRQIPTAFSSWLMISVSAWQLQMRYFYSYPFFDSVIIAPHVCATKCAASFPLGSIIPKKRSSRLSYQPYFSYAEVPVIIDAYFETTTRIRWGCNPKLSQIDKTVAKFIIFVKDAISLLLKFPFPLRNLSSRIQQSTQL